MNDLIEVRPANRRKNIAHSFSTWRLVAGCLFALATILLLGNSLFLFATAGSDALLAWMLRVHVWLGYTFAALAVAFSVPHYLVRRRHGNARARWIGYSFAILLLGSCGLGIYLSVTGLGPRYRMLLRLHEFLFVLALVGYLSHRLVAISTPVWRYEWMALAACFVVFFGLMSIRQPSGTSRIADQSDAVKNTIVSDAHSRTDSTQFFASRASTIDGHFLSETDLNNPAYCAQCHTEIAQQWDGSAHHFSSMNDPFYAQIFQTLQRKEPAEKTRFCGGCHDPAIIFPGNMTGDVSPQSKNSDFGITCLACHAIVEVPDRIGNAGYVIAEPEHYPYYNSSDPAERELNLQLIRAKPEKHKQSFLKPIHRTSEFCLACHKVSLDVGVNNYRWKRGQNDYDSWHDSSFGLQSALTFYNAEQQQNCQHCHMPDVPTNDPAARDGLTKDHTFRGANTALPFVHNRPEWSKKTEEFLKDCVTVDIFSAMLRAGQPDAQRIFPLERTDAAFPAGQTVQVEVMLRNRTVGHEFASGTADLNEPWLEFTVSDMEGNMVLASGLLDDTGRLDPYAHKFIVVMLTREGRRVDIHNVEEFYTVLYNNTIPANNTEIVRYDIPIPAELAGKQIVLRAKLLYRKLNRPFTEFGLGPDAPALPIVNISEDSLTIPIVESISQLPPIANEAEIALRINDFGIGHFRQGNLKTALWAFNRVTSLLPEDADAWINIARCQLREGNYAEMESTLRAADQARPGFHKTAYFLGKLRHSQGRFDEAIEAYRNTLDSFPNDRVVNLALAQTLFQHEQLDDAIEVLKHSLEIDPEDQTAHTLLFRCYSAKGDTDNAEVHREESLRYQPQQAEVASSEIYRRNHPHDDIEANLEHVHSLHKISDWSAPISTNGEQDVEHRAP